MLIYLFCFGLLIVDGYPVFLLIPVLGAVHVHRLQQTKNKNSFKCDAYFVQIFPFPGGKNRQVFSELQDNKSLLTSEETMGTLHFPKQKIICFVFHVA